MTSLVPLFPSWGWRGSVDTTLPISPCDLLSTVDHSDKPLSISGPRGYCDRVHAALPKPPGPAPVLVCQLPTECDPCCHQGTTFITRVSTLSLDGGFLAVRVVGSGDRTPSEVNHRVERWSLQVPHICGGRYSGGYPLSFSYLFSTLFFCVISLMFPVLCPSLSGFEIQEVGVYPTKSCPCPSYPFLNLSGN